MPSTLRYSALAALLSTVSAYAVVPALPSQTIGGHPQPFLEPTTAPSLELVRKKLEKKALINTCTEWTISGGFGQPACSNSETCLFTTDFNGYLYEGCGQTSIQYNWISECFDYGDRTGIAPVSEIYCGKAAPYCGFYAFILDEDQTFYNYDCSTVAYSLYVELLPSSAGASSSELFLAGGGTTELSVVPSTVFVTPTAQPSPTANNGQQSSAPSTTPIIGQHSKSKAPIGAIVGGVVGGIAMIAFIAFLIWFGLRKRRQDASARAATAQQQSDATNAAAWNQPQIPEIGGTAKPAGAYIPPTGVHLEKQEINANTQAAYAQPSPSPNKGTYDESMNIGSQSPPPTYTNPQPQSPSSYVPTPPTNLSELDHQDGRATHSVTPISPSGTLLPPSPQSPTPHDPNISELGGTNRGSWLVPEGVQEMSGASTGGINRRPVSGNTRQSGMDMSGAPISEEFLSHHELE